MRGGRDCWRSARTPTRPSGQSCWLKLGGSRLSWWRRVVSRGCGWGPVWRHGMQLPSWVGRAISRVRMGFRQDLLRHECGHECGAKPEASLRAVSRFHETATLLCRKPLLPAECVPQNLIQLVLVAHR